MWPAALGCLRPLWGLSFNTRVLTLGFGHSLGSTPSLRSGPASLLLLRDPFPQPLLSAKDRQGPMDDVVPWLCGYLSAQLSPARAGKVLDGRLAPFLFHVSWCPAQTGPRGSWGCLWGLLPAPETPRCLIPQSAVLLCGEPVLGRQRSTWATPGITGLQETRAMSTSTEPARRPFGHLLRVGLAHTWAPPPGAVDSGPPLPSPSLPLSLAGWRGHSPLRRG